MLLGVIFVLSLTVVSCNSPSKDHIFRLTKKAVDTKPTEEPHIETEITTDNEKFLVISDSAYLVKAFNIAKNFQVSKKYCYAKYLPIDFNLRIKNTSVITTGFLDPTRDKIHFEQDYSSVCRKIRK
jgi:hypothetical protein